MESYLKFHTTKMTEDIVRERQIQQERIKNIILKVYQVFKIRLEDIYTSLLILDSETSPEEQVQELLNKMDM